MQMTYCVKSIADDFSKSIQWTFEITCMEDTPESATEVPKFLLSSFCTDPDISASVVFLVGSKF